MLKFWNTLWDKRRTAYQATKRRRQRGQNLVELVLTLPFMLLIVFGIIEMGRAWQTYQGAKMAAVDGAYTSSVFKDIDLGKEQIVARLEQAQIPYDPASVIVEAVSNTGGNNVTIGYKAQVRVLFRPVFGSMQIPTLNEPIVLIPEEFPIEYAEIYYSSIY